MSPVSFMCGLQTWHFLFVLFHLVWPAGRDQECTWWKTTDALSAVWQLWVTYRLVISFFYSVCLACICFAETKLITRVLFHFGKWFLKRRMYVTGVGSWKCMFQRPFWLLFGLFDSLLPRGQLKMFWMLHKLVLQPCNQVVLTLTVNRHLSKHAAPQH